MGLTEQERKAIADKYAGAACTLNGLPARVTGRLCDYATIAQLNSGLSAEWSWPAVERVMLTGGNFKS